MEEFTEWGFPKGRVAKTLREALYPDLNDAEVEAIVVCLLAHLLVEDRINGIMYRWLVHDPPKADTQKKTEKLKNELHKTITKMNFSTKYQLMFPFFSENFPVESKDIWKLNDLRNEIFHGKSIKEAKFKGKLISEEKTVESLFVAAQMAVMQLDKFDELLYEPKALAENRANRLKELGEPLR